MGGSDRVAVHRARVTKVFVLVALAASLLLVGAPRASAEPPSNDLIENAIVIDTVPFSATQTTAEATSGPTDPADCRYPDESTIWFKFAAAVDAPLRFSLDGVDVSLVSFQGSPGELTHLRCDRSQLLATRAGTTYFFMVTSLGSNQITLDVRPPVPPANDLIENATPVESLPFTGTFSTFDASASDTDPVPTCSPAGLQTVWFQYTAPATGALHVFSSYFFGPAQVLFEGTPGNLTPIACNSVGALGVVRVEFGKSYYLMAATSQFDTSFTLTIREAHPPSNDLIEDAALIGQLPFTSTQGTEDATDDPRLLCSMGVGSNVWFRYDAQLDGALRVTESSSFLPVTMLEATPSELRHIGCPGFSQNPVPVEAGKTYYFMITTRSTPFTLRVEAASPPSNDLIQNATTVDALPFTAIQSMTDATISPDDPHAVCNPPFHVVATAWYRYDADANRTLEVTSGHGLLIFEGAPGSLTPVVCAGLSKERVSVDAGRSYFVMVFGSPFTQPFTVQVRDTADVMAPMLTLPSGVSVAATSKVGATTTYTVTATDDSDPNPVVNCSPVSGSTFKIGDTTVTCSATDVAGNTSTGSFVVHVKGALEQIADLRLVVRALPANSPWRSLDTTLMQAARALRENKVAQACSLLQQFKDQVRAAKGKTIPEATANRLIADASRIRTVACW